MKRLLLFAIALLFAAHALAEDARLFWLPMVAPPAIVTAHSPEAAGLDGIGVAVNVDPGFNRITITVKYSIEGKSAIATRTVGAPGNLPWMETPGAWFPLWPHSVTVSRGFTVASIGVTVQRGPVESGKTVVFPQAYNWY